MAGSNDIDVMVVGMSGRDFAEKVAQYLKDIKKEPGKNVGVIEARPEQSKNLETAVLNIYGNSVDFVAPRKEVYTSDSRIPQVTDASPAEDASRRDFNFNSLMLDIETGDLKDFTGKGIEDIKNKVVRTPLDPKITFSDDPLRIMRALRFATKLGFALDPAIIEAAKDPAIQQAFRTKISRERMHDEFRKMLTGPNPVEAMKLLTALGLRDEVLKLPEHYEPWEMEQNSPHHDFNVLDHTLQVLSNLQQIIQSRNLSDADKFVLNLAALCHDLGKLDPAIKQTKQVGDKIITTYNGHEAESAKAAEYMLRNLPGTKVEEIEAVKRLISGYMAVNPDRRDSSEAYNRSQKALGKFVRELGDLWEHAVDLYHADSSGHKVNQFATHSTTWYDTMKEQARILNPQAIKDLKPLLNGGELMALFGRKGGPWISVVTKALIDWQLENRNATKDQASEFVKKLYEEQGLAKVAAISKRAKENQVVSWNTVDLMNNNLNALQDLATRSVTNMKEHDTVHAANFDKPIVIKEDGTVMEGLHTVLKAVMQGVNSLPVIVIKEDQADDEASKYQREAKDPKWNEVLIDKDGTKLTRRQIRDHYVKNAGRIMKEIKDHPVMLYIGTAKNQNILKRHHNDKPIIITNAKPENSGNSDNLIYWADRRLLSIHRVYNKNTKQGHVDLDLHGDFPFARAKEYAYKVAAQIKKEFGVTASLWASGGSGIHIQFELGQEMDIDQLRHQLKAMLDELNKGTQDITTGLVKGSGLRADVTTLKNEGNLRVSYSLGEVYGKVKKPLISSRA